MTSRSFLGRCSNGIWPNRLSQADHRMNHVRGWVQQRLHTLGRECMTDDKLNWYARVPELKLYDGSALLTEEEWLSCPLSWVMLRHLYRNRNGRKRRLFAVACCRHISDFIPAPFFPLL